MFNRGNRAQRTPKDRSRTIDLIIVMAAGVFFANIVIGESEKTKSILAMSADFETCAIGCDIAEAALTK